MPTLGPLNRQMLMLLDQVTVKWLMENRSVTNQKFDEVLGGTTGQVLKKKSNTDNDVEWADDEVGTPAATVTDETTFGITKAVGNSTNYARENHTHGSPTLDIDPLLTADSDSTVSSQKAVKAYADTLILFGAGNPPDPTGLRDGTVYMRYTP